MPSMRLASFRLLGATLLLCPLLVQAQSLEPVWQHVELGTNIGGSGLWTGDLDGDGAHEIILGTDDFPNRRLVVMTYAEGEYVQRWASAPYAEPGIAQTLVANLDGDGDAEIYALLTDGRIDIYDGTALERTETAELEGGAPQRALFADVDDDGTTELVVRGAFGLQVYDALTLALEWSTEEYGGSDGLAVGDVDGDGEAEIVLADGFVLGGTSHAVEWRYLSGFGREVVLGNIDADPALEIFASAGSYYITAYDAEIRTPLWQIETGSEIAALLLADVDGDGDVEAVVGEGQWGDIKGYDLQTRQLIWSVNNPEHGVTRVAVGDPDGDGMPEVLWGAGQYSSGQDNLFVAGIGTEEIEWRSLDLDGPFFVGQTDVDGDDVADIVALSRASRSGYDGGVLLVYDGITHALKWTLSTSSYDDVQAVGVGDVTGDGRGDIVYAAGSYSNGLRVIDGATREETTLTTGLENVRVIELVDLDGDDVAEILLGDTEGRVALLAGITFETIWQSIATGYPIGGIAVAECDDDAADEIVFFGRGGLVQMYDAQTHYLEWKSADLGDVSALAVADTDRDGTAEILTGHESGEVRVTTCGTFETVTTASVSDAAVTAIRPAALDLTPEPELLVGTGDTYYYPQTLATLKALRASDLTTVWESEPLGYVVGGPGRLSIGDFDGDRYTDVLVGTDGSFVQFRAAEPYPDVVPPVVLTTIPADGATAVEVDTPIRATFSEPIDPTSLVDRVALTADGASIGFSTTYDEALRVLILTPAEHLPPSSAIEVRLSGLIADSTGNGLDGNGNGVSDGTADDVAWTFVTGTSVDDVGPTVMALSVGKETIWSGVPLTVTAALSDSSTVATNYIAAAELFVDAPGDPGTGTPMAALDGTFDAAEEIAQATLETAGWEPGTHTLHVRGLDTRGNWGDLAAVEIAVQGDATPSWPMIGHNPQHTGFVEGSEVAPPFRSMWSPDLGSDPSGIAAANGALYATHRYHSGGAALSALDAETGETRWTYGFGSVTIGAPAFAYGLVFVQTNDHTPGSYVWALDAETGAVRWQTPYDAQWSQGSGPTVAAGKVFVNGGYYGGMYAYDAFSGEELWFFNLPQISDWTPAYADGVVYAGPGSYAVDAETGALLAQYPNSGLTPVIHDGTLFTTSPVSAIDLETGSVRWSVDGYLEPAIGYGMVFVPYGSGLRAYDEATGTLRWNIDLGYTAEGSPLLANGYAFVRANGRTIAVDVATQAIAWSTSVGGPIAVAGDRLYVFSSSGEVLGFESVPVDAEDGATPHRFALEQNFPNPFDRTTQITYSLPTTERVTLEVFNALGQRVATLIEGLQQPGVHAVEWTPSGLSSGVYHLRLRAGTQVLTKRAALVR